MARRSNRESIRRRLEQPLIDRLTALLTPAVELARAFRADVSPIDSAALEQESAEEEDEESDEQEDDSVEQFEHWRAGTAEELPDENLAWEVLQQFWMPAIALFSASARARASAQHVRPLAGEIAELHEAGHWLAMILGVLNEEPILVIEPDTELGIVGSISGVVDNFQLQVLLMDGFPKRGLLAGRRVSKKVAEIAHGDGPQQGSATVTGSWNMYTWQALEPDLTLPSDQSSCDHWIWNEGAPEDIPVFEGYRVVLLGPASYPRMWQAQRMFTALRANLAIDRELSPEETRSWLQKMGAAGRSD